MVVQPQPATALVDSYPGEVRARYEPELAFRIAGKVAKRMVDVGDRVKKDQPLAELDPQDVRLQLEATRAQVAAAEANLQTVRAERERYKALLERNLVSRSQFDNVENQYRAGTVDYNSVVTVQATALSNERSNLTLLGNRLLASVQLIAALGGGWQVEQLQEQASSAD